MLKQRGDTIVEVAVAFSIFALLAMGSIVIMNQGTAIAQRSLEQTQVRQVINGQADMLRTARQDPALWAVIIQPSNLVTSVTAASTSSCAASVPPRSFVIAENAAGTALRYTPLTTSNFAKPPVSSYIDYNTPRAWGVWVQTVKISSATANSPAAYDLHIRACWDTVGTTVPATLATIVRLYDQNN